MLRLCWQGNQIFILFSVVQNNELLMQCVHQRSSRNASCGHLMCFGGVKFLNCRAFYNMKYLAKLCVNRIGISARLVIPYTRYEPRPYEHQRFPRDWKKIICELVRLQKFHQCLKPYCKKKIHIKFKIFCEAGNDRI